MKEEGNLASFSDALKQTNALSVMCIATWRRRVSLSECSENKLLQSQQHPSEATYDLTSWETRQSRKIHIGQYLFRYDIPIPPHWRSD
jgi:hypothetical protein